MCQTGETKTLGDYKAKKKENLRKNGDAQHLTKIEPAKCSTII